MSGTSRGKSGTSSVSLKSAKSVVEKIPKTRVCPWVAQWFTIPQAVVKTLELTVGAVAVILMLLWQSEDITIADLNSGTVNLRNGLYTYVGVGVLTALYAVGMTTVGFGGFQIPPILQAALSGVMLLAWTLSAPVTSASLRLLNDSLFARSRDLNILYLQIASGFGFLLIFLFLVDILLAFMGLNNLDENSKQIQQELTKSRSTLQAIRSGMLPDKAKAKKKRHRSSKKRSIDEKSPLKSHEGDGEDEEASDTQAHPV